MDYKGLLNQYYHEGKIDMAEVIDELDQYYEAAGFEDFYNRVLSPMDDQELLDYFAKTFLGVVGEEELEAYGQETLEGIKEASKEALEKVLIKDN